LANDEVALRRREKKAECRTLVAARHPSNRHVCEPCSKLRGVGRRGRIGGRIGDPVLGDDIDADPARSDFGIDRANVGDLSPTRGAIGRADRRSSQSVGSADDDDLPSPTSQHLRQRWARKAIQRMHHHIEHPAPVGVVDLISGPSIVPGHQVGDKNIDSSRGLHQALRVIRIGRIGVIARDIRTFGLE
jgi:hypothetical protein